MGRLDGKVALITGARQRHGSRAPPSCSRAEGARVVVADFDETTARRGRRDRGGRRRGRVRQGRRVGRRRRSRRWSPFAVERSAALHVLYNNAGIFPADDGGATETPESTWERVMDVNLKGVWLGCKYGIPAMLAVGRRVDRQRRVVRRASWARRPRRSRTPRARAAVLSMTREIAVEYAPAGHPRQLAVPRPDRDADARGADERPGATRSGASCTSRWAASAGPRSWRRPRCSSRPTSRRS